MGQSTQDQQRQAALEAKKSNTSLTPTEQSELTGLQAEVK
jgi:hypothetical protein